jgi:hypothetical protein
MSGGGLIQIVAYGAQDVYLTGDPQVSWFKTVYRRHTNFATENIRLPISNAGFGVLAYVLVTRSADLITQCYLEVHLPKVSLPTNLTGSGGAPTSTGMNARFAWVRKIGHSMLDYYYVNIGNVEADRQYTNWLNIWQEMTMTKDQALNYNTLIGDVPELTELRAPNAQGVFTDEYTVYMPLQFWFCRNNGLALPLIALQYHEVRLYFKFRPFDECVIINQYIPSASSLVTSAMGGQLNCSVATEYIYLDSDERRRYAQVGHEYLMEETQWSPEIALTSTSINQAMYFNHPSKFVTWVIQNGSYKGGNFFSYSDTNCWKKALDDAATKLLLGQIQVNSIATATVPALTGYNLYGADMIGQAGPAGYGFYPVQITDWASSSGGSGIPILASVLRKLDPINDISQGATPYVQAKSISGYDLGNRNLIDCSHYTATLDLEGLGVYIDSNGQIDPSSITSTGAIAQSSVAVLNPAGTEYGFTGASTAPSTHQPLAFPFIDNGAFTIQPANLTHNLSVVDLSRAVQKYNDFRPQWVQMLDITVYQHHNYGVLIDGTVNPIQHGNIKLNGQDRFEVKDGTYFTRLQANQHIECSPADGINFFSFALKPLLHQPSGTCNFSRLDSAQLVMNITSSKKSTYLPDDIRVDLLNLSQGSGTQLPATKLAMYCFNYNVARILSGMFGKAYSN